MAIDERDAQIFGKLNALEFVVEVMMANRLAEMSEGAAEEVLTVMGSKPGYVKKGPVDADDLQAVEAATQASLENLAQKVAARSREIREELAQGR